ESVKRLKSFDLRKHPEHLAALERVLERTRGTPTFVDLVGQFGLANRYPDLLAVAQKHPDQQIGVTAVRTLLENGQSGLSARGLQGKDNTVVLATIQALTTAAAARATPLLLAFVQNSQHDVEQRRQAVRALAKSKNGAAALLKLAQANELRDELKEVA